MKTIKYLIAIFCFLFTFNSIYTQAPPTGDNYYSTYNYMMNYFTGVADSMGINYWEVDGWKEFIRFVHYFEYRHDEEGNLTDYPQVLESYFAGSGDNSGDVLPVWEYIGHDGIYPDVNGNHDCDIGQGNIASLWVDPYNHFEILAGGHTGGLWKTTDGGNNWYCISNTEPLINGICNIEVDPANHNKIYIASAPQCQTKLGYSFGLFFTQDGGNTWTNNKVYIPGQGSLYFSSQIKNKPVKLLVNPQDNQKMFLITWYKLLRSLDGGVNWEILLDKEGVYNAYWNELAFKDMEFDPTDPSIIYVSGVEVFKLTNNGDNIIDITSSITQFSGGTPGEYKIIIGTSPVNLNKIWFAVKAYGTSSLNDNDNLVVYNKNTGNATLLHAGKFFDKLKMQCEVSPLEEDIILIGGISTEMYIGTLTPPIRTVSHCNSSSDWTHVDVRDAVYLSDAQGNHIIYVANDGSVFKTMCFNPRVDNWVWSYIGNDGSNGIRNAEYHGFDCSNSENDIIYLGFQDMNSAVRLNGQWYNVLEGDGGPGWIDNTDPMYLYGSYYNSPARLHRSINGGYHFSFIHSLNVHSKPPFGSLSLNPEVLFAGDRYVLRKYQDARQSNVWNPLLTIPQDTYSPGSLWINEIATSESNNNVIYVSTDRYLPTWVNPQPPHEKAIYKTVNGGGNGSYTDWSDLTDNLYDGLKGGPITGITINPCNENEVWVCFGNTSTDPSANVAKKAYFTNDGGSTWTAKSDGLPENIPANDIQYEKTNGVVYLVNDVGIYYFDNDADTWYNIINNGPTNRLTVIRFNYALNKIRFGSFGRGAWQADIPCFYSQNSIVINSTETWDDIRFTRADVIVSPGAELTISGSAYFPEQARLVVKRGGKLIIDGGTLSNACDNLWQGIELWGDANNPQTLPYQGVVEIINGGTIENAVCGIRTIRMMPDGVGVDSDYSGGIIWADNANFINNQTAVQFYSYPDYSSSSHFYRTTFRTNDELKGGEIPDYFIKMSGVHGIEIRGCEFGNTRLEGECPFSERGSGIFSAGSNYLVREFESGGQTWTTAFESLVYGIKALAVSSDMTISVKNSQFNNNYRSIYLSGIPQAEVTGNEFLCRDVPEMYDSYGLYLDGCSGYDVWENYFYSENENGESIGLIVNNSNLTGDENNLIYDNYFYQLDYAALAQNANRSVTGYPGLQFKCNDFTDNNQDLAVTYEGELTHWMGIAAEQGSNEDDQTAPAGNRFSYVGSLEEPTDINNEALHIDYWYHNPNYNLRLIPRFYTEGTVTPKHNDQIWNVETCCPPLYGSGGGGGSEETLGEMTEAAFIADSISVVIQTLEYGGSTEMLKWDIDMSAPPQATDIYNDLMSQSPYVSDSVMESAVEKENVLVDAMIRDIMVANPESAKNDELIEGLEQRTNPPPACMMGQILEGRSLVSVYGALKSQLSFYRLKQSIAFKKLARYYLTTYPDSLMVLLSGTKGLSNVYNLAFMHLANGNTTAGSNLLISLPGLYTLSSEDIEVYDNMVDYFNLIAQSGLGAPDSITIQALVSMVEKPGLAGVYARNRLLEVDEIQYEEPVLLPDPLKSGKNADKYEVYMAASGSIKRLEVYPNPAAGLVILSWHLEVLSKNASLVITGIDGKTLREIPVTDRENKEVIDTNDLLPGVYLATLYIDGKQLESTKFSILR